MIQMGGVDLSVFQFDPFLSWSVFFMNADKTIYGRYGTASPKTRRNKPDSNPNHTTQGLKASLRRALEVHAAYTKDPEGYGKKLSGKTGPAPTWKTPERSPAARRKKMGKVRGSDERSCFH